MNQPSLYLGLRKECVGLLSLYIVLSMRHLLQAFNGTMYSYDMEIISACNITTWPVASEFGKKCFGQSLQCNSPLFNSGRASGSDGRASKL